MSKNNSFKVAALAASIALAMSATSAMAAAPTATQLPGQGKVTVTGLSTIVGTVNADGDGLAVDVSGFGVINWGKGTATTDINNKGVAGFNIGADASVTFTGTSTTTSPLTDAVLNIDSSGNASQIFGTLTADNVSVFVANTNGVIVGDHATINGTGGTVGLIANTLSSTAADDFNATNAVEYSGTGGDVTVQAGADLASVTLISGGGTVNVDAGGLNSAVILSAGVSSATAGGFATDNDAAKLAVTGDGIVASFSSAGDASSSGALTVNGGDVVGTFTNTGTLTLADGFAIDGVLVNEKAVNATGATFGGLSNDGQFTASTVETTDSGISNNGQLSVGAITAAGGLANTGEVDSTGAVSVSGGDFTNGGIFNGTGSVTVNGGNLTNSGSLTGTGNAQVNDGSITNSGTLSGFNEVYTSSNSDDEAFTAGADYSITNTGKMVFAGTLDVEANYEGSRAGGTDNDSTGSFSNTGTLQVGTASGLDIYANDNIDLGGAVQVMKAGKYAAVSSSNLLSSFDVEADNGALTVATPLVFGRTEGGYTPSDLYGQTVNVMADVSGAGTGYTTLWIHGGDKVADGYAIRIGNGVTVSAEDVGLAGWEGTDHPNVILQGTVAANNIYLGDGEGSYQAVSDVFTGPNGGLVATGEEPEIYMDFTGRIKNAPYSNDGNFRYNYLPITVADDSSVYLQLNPVAYDTNGTNNGLSAVNILVNGDVELYQEGPSAYVTGGESAVTGVTNLPNTHLVVQSTGNISTYDAFFWPGYVYLGTIAANADGSAAPGTLGLGQITLGGNFNNALPGDVSGASGVHFISQFPLGLDDGEGGFYSVTTNANAWVNFGTDLLTQGYATGTLGGSFFGGTQGSGTVVNYGELDASMFHTHAPVATR